MGRARGKSADVGETGVHQYEAAPSRRNELSPDSSSCHPHASFRVPSRCGIASTHCPGPNCLSASAESSVATEAQSAAIESKPPLPQRSLVQVCHVPRIVGRRQTASMVWSRKLQEENNFREKGVALSREMRILAVGGESGSWIFVIWRNAATCDLRSTSLSS
ncbi:hypothetical protein OH77DRAFT_40855 [Trametes cingulata]|nr:hypothetical protein OH77DRAFT_40855 [Trametes cingulata]